MWPMGSGWGLVCISKCSDASVSCQRAAFIDILSKTELPAWAAGFLVVGRWRGGVASIGIGDGVEGGSDLERCVLGIN